MLAAAGAAAAFWQVANGFTRYLKAKPDYYG